LENLPRGVDRDYTKVSPTKLYEEQAFSELSKMPAAPQLRRLTEGTEILDEIATVPEVTRTVEGSRIQKYLIDQQNSRRRLSSTSQKERLIEKEKELATVYKRLNQLLPFEVTESNFEQKHSNAIYEGSTTSKLTKKTFGVTMKICEKRSNMKADCENDRACRNMVSRC